MAADAGIHNAFAQRPKSAVEYQSEYAAADDAKIGRQMNMLQLQSAQQAQTDQQGLRNYLQGSPDLSSSAGQQGLYKVAPTAAAGILKGQAELGKTTAETAKATADTATKTYELKVKKATEALRDIGNFSSADEAIQSLIAHQQAGDVDAQKAQIMFGQLQQLRNNPQGFSQWQQQMRLGILDAKDRLEQQWKAKEYTDPKADALLAAQTSRANNTATVGATMRGQNMTDARSREGLAIGRVPSGYRQNPDGSLAFIPGGPADPAAAKKAAPTEFQGKNALFGARAQEASKAFDVLSAAGVNQAGTTKRVAEAVGGMVPFYGDGAAEAAGTLTNWTQSADQQRVEQSQRDFINAVLRLESGAAIGKDEFTNARKQYFPQPGDSKEVIVQKKANRDLAVSGLLGNAGTATIPTPTAEPAPASAGVKPFAADKEARYQAWKKANGQ